MSDGLAVLIAVVLLAANAFFVGAEFSLVAARRTQLEPLAAEGSRRARATIQAMRMVSLMMAGAQLGITLCSLGLGAVAEPAVAHFVEPVLELAGVPEGWLHPISLAIALLIVVSLHVVIGEMVPKNLCLAAPERSAVLLGPPLASYVRAIRPVIVALNAISNRSLRIVGVEPQDEVTSAASGSELGEMVEQSRREGLMDSEEHSRVSHTLAFNTRTAVDALIPRSRVQVLATDSTLAQAEEMAGATGHSRFPLADDWSHYVHLKDVIGCQNDALGDPASTVVRPLPGVAGDAPLIDVLAAMRDGSTHVLRVDEGDAVLGMVTLDDVLLALLPAEAPPAGGVS